MAYQNTPNTGLLAGQTTVTIAGINNSYLNQITSITTDQLAIKAEFTEYVTGSITLINSVGAIVKSLDIEGTTCAIGIEGMQAGLYHVYISSKEGILSRKILLK
jgi:hypothetical protein